VLHWYLRDFQHAQIGESLPPGIQYDAIISQAAIFLVKARPTLLAAGSAAGTSVLRRTVRRCRWMFFQWDDLSY
jgi:hypothetical protein